MHIFIGGAYNGKRAYVAQLLVAENRNIVWYEGELPPIGKTPIVIAGLEKWITASSLSEQEVIAAVLAVCEGREVYFIATDIGRGIVPIDKVDRQLRDCVGRLYQKLFQNAESVTRIWYGIPKLLKGEIAR